MSMIDPKGSRCARHALDQIRVLRAQQPAPDYVVLLRRSKAAPCESTDQREQVLEFVKNEN